MREIELTGAFFTREKPVGFYLSTEEEQGESFCIACGEHHAVWFERFKKGTILNINGLHFENLYFSTYGYLYKMTSITQITDDMPIVNLKDVLVSPQFCVEKLNIPLPQEKPTRLLLRLKFFLSSHIFLAHIIYCNLFLLVYRLLTH